MTTQSAFPTKTALAIGAVGVALMTWHGFVRSSTAAYPPGLDWRTLPAVASLPILHRNALPVARPAPTVSPITMASQIEAPPPSDALLVDNSGSLDTFYAALAGLDKHSPGASATVVHFGDSPTTADLITGDVRQQLQQRFGDAGPGFNLIAKPWAWYQHRDIDETDQGWKFTTAVGLMREGQFGIGGVGFDGDHDAFVRYKFSGIGPDAVQLMWRSQPGGGDVQILANDVVVATIETATPTEAPADVAPPARPSLANPATQSPQFTTVKIPAAARSISLRVTQGSVHLFGVVFVRNQPGLTYDSIGLNGASITVLSRAIAKDMLKRSFLHLHPDLVVINYGTNEAGFPSFIDKQYEGELRMAIARVREAAPNASIMLMSPMDRGERGPGNAIVTMATIPKIITIQQRVASDTGCAFFNTYEAMGGDGTIQRWYEGKPRLVGGDLIHPTPQGAKIVASSFVEQLEHGYERYKVRIGHMPEAPAHRSLKMGENTKR